MLKEHQTFDNFIVGKYNQQAYKLAKYIVNCSDEEIIDLYFFGNHCGKSHLMSAVATGFKEFYPEANVICITGETFIVEYIKALTEVNLHGFENKFYNADFLIINNLQALAKKEMVQEKLATIIKILQSKNKRIVLTADKPGHLIGITNYDLLFFLSEALSVGIGVADHASKVKILETKFDGIELKNSSEVKIILDFIADAMGDNLSELAGAVERVKVFCEILEKPPTFEFVKEILADKIQG